MPLPILKEDATLEEMRAWTVQVNDTYNTLETNLDVKTKREKELEEINQKFFLKITSTVEGKETKKEDDKPLFLDKKSFDEMDKHQLKLLKDIEEEE